MTPVLLDSDTLSELSRDQQHVTRRTKAYLEHHGRLTISAITVFERLRGYRSALREGKPFEVQLRQFQALAATCIVLPVDEVVADQAANIWAQLSTKRRQGLGDILIAATAIVNRLPLVTRNNKDFTVIGRCDGDSLESRRTAS